jgi:DNA-binding transcriptional ArsR family regulator/uncharacterized protein YndB with AHSA1/START domain
MKADLAPIWRALADPTRRDILDLLRERPRTTGELADAFPSTRFAVMKHLEVLVEAGLVVARKQGRERWNHLNAVPLQALYERWVRPYEAHWAAGLWRLKDLSEKPAGGAMSQSELGLVRVEQEIAIAARPERVWQALVEEIGHWWPKDFYAGADAENFILEPRLGGRMYEDWGNGAGAVWYTVTEIAPPRSLGLAGHYPPVFGGPSTSILRLEVVAGEAGEGAVLRLSDSEFRPVTENTFQSLDEGWRTIFNHLKEYVEEGEG